jgi:hypothetical protein
MFVFLTFNIIKNEMYLLVNRSIIRVLVEKTIQLPPTKIVIIIVIIIKVIKQNLIKFVCSSGSYVTPRWK